MNNNKGFTLLEMVAVIFIITLFASMVINNFSEIRDQLALRRAGHKLVLDIRKAQAMAMSSTQVDSCLSYAPLHFASLSNLALGGHIAKDDPPPPQIVIVSCTSSPNPVQINESTTFSFVTEGGQGNYLYTWSGDCVGTGLTCSTSFASAGNYSTTLTVSRSSGTIIATKQCSVVVSGGPSGPQGGHPLYEPMQLEPPAILAYGYGIYINPATLTNKNYILYADTESDGSPDCTTLPDLCYGYYTAADCIVENISIGEKGVVIKQINNSVPQKVSINFAPPNPDTTIKWMDPGSTEIEIVLALERNLNKTMTIAVNKVGMIEVR
ncbi:MAG: type II secretion system protein [Candidatus Staskawiczbacteria bacterium]|jgi:prepilin-type N-terminal cleavage/methylation domain-containing protein